jgi:hypothetical protein
MVDEPLSASYRARLRAYRYGTAAFKIDYAWKARTQPRSQFQTSSRKSHRYPSVDRWYTLFA